MGVRCLRQIPVAEGSWKAWAKMMISGTRIEVANLRIGCQRQTSVKPIPTKSLGLGKRNPFRQRRIDITIRQVRSK